MSLAPFKSRFPVKCFSCGKPELVKKDSLQVIVISQAQVGYHCYYTRPMSACDITGLYPTTFDHKQILLCLITINTLSCL